MSSGRIGTRYKEFLTTSLGEQCLTFSPHAKAPCDRLINEKSTFKIRRFVLALAPPRRQIEHPHPADEQALTLEKKPQSTNP